MKNGTNQAIYLYCLARSDLVAAMEGTGLDGQNLLFLQRWQDIVAVLSKVNLDEFCGPSAESRMEDLSWVGPRACHHEQVVEEVMRRSPVFPVRFGTIFSSLEGLEKILKMHHGAISRFLDRVADEDEWSVKGLIDRAKAKEQLLSETFSKEAGRLAALSSGTRYFQEQRIQAEVEKELNVWLRGACKPIANDLTRYASDFSERKVLSRDITGRDMVLNWAFLIPRDSVADFRARVDRANEDHEWHGLTFTLSGPWPPYSFCSFFEMEER